MGIRFHCPQGHKLNVKSFLAGKRGICPHCGAKVEIPLSSTRQSTKDGDGPEMDSLLSGGTNTPAAATAAPIAKPVATPVGGAPLAKPVSAGGALATPAPGAVQNTPVASRGGEVARSPVSVDTIPQATAVAPPGPVGTGQPNFDPIADAPAAVWYVRPRSGGQYGPANGDILRQWIDQGRVMADSLVWREGWPEWKNAVEAFPDLAADSSASSRGGDVDSSGPPTGTLPSTAFRESAASETSAMTIRPAAQRKSNQLILLYVIALSVVILGLMGVLTTVLVNGPLW